MEEGETSTITHHRQIEGRGRTQTQTKDSNSRRTQATNTHVHEQFNILTLQLFIVSDKQFFIGNLPMIMDPHNTHAHATNKGV